MKKQIKGLSLAFFLLGFLIITSCKKEKDEGTVVGYVYTANGLMPLAGVSVYVKEIQSISTKSNSEGYFELKEVPTGTQTIVLTLGSFKNEIKLNVRSGENVISTKDSPIKLGTGEGAVKVKMAVIWGSYDSIQDILDSLGFPRISNPNVDSTGYVLYYSPSDLLNDLNLLNKFSIVFINCGADEYIDPTMINNIKEYVQSGKSLYASDWAYCFVENPFPEYIDFYGEDTIPGDAKVGEEEMVTALVVDQGLKEQLGKDNVEINFNLGSWVIMNEVSNNTQTMIKATVHDFYGNTLPDRPIMVKFKYGNGRVLYTSFHNEAQNTEDMEKILIRIIYEL